MKNTPDIHIALELTMRIPTNDEWDQLMDITGEDDAVTHWDHMFSWVQQKKLGKYDDEPYSPASRGFKTARSISYSDRYTRYKNVGFRPAFDVSGIHASIGAGDGIVVGTLYMDGVPVRVPTVSSWGKDIVEYIPGTTLEMRSPLEDPAYQVQTIMLHTSNPVLISDKVLLKNISYEDIKQVLSEKK